MPDLASEALPRFVRGQPTIRPTADDLATVAQLDTIVYYGVESHVNQSEGI
jgi:hypothetical protein